MVSTTTISEGEVRLAVKGSLHGEVASAFQLELEALLSSGYRTITLDLSEVPSINSSSIGRILLSRKRLAEQGRAIRIDGCSDPLYGTFQLIRLERLVPVSR